jgi:hypothetical protein
MLELDDIQHILLMRVPALTGRYEFLSFRSATGGRTWLSAIKEKVQSAAEVRASAEKEKRWVTFSIDGDVFNASVGSIVVIPAGAHHAWRNRSNSPIRMSTFFSPGGVEELYPKLVGLSLEELSTVVEQFGSGIVGPPIDP